ncbi:phosphatase PAP2 family protein [Lapidilactobacillus wuchangensis]|uniref:phosphatase PAP2 family protein n=1 Tax=Lapidilactobacillus wuchangensis TaxID=2486001 RepID=UPI000F76DE9E|nr:phosphatase PAP2 family protein [Lapidilactobacillus wuchangensis]
MTKKRITVGTAIILCYVAFVIFMLGVKNHQAWINGYDQTIYRWIQPLHPNFDQFFIAFTKIGNPVNMTVLTAIVMLILVIGKHWRLAIFLGLNNGLGSLFNHFVKHWVLRPRPSHKLIPETGYSFPSGHATAAIMFFGSLIVIGFCLVHSKKQRGLIIGIALVLIFLLGLSRLVVHVHYPSDVTAGFLLATANLLVHWLIAKRTYLKQYYSAQPDLNHAN